jgi:hypothetical protein
MTNLQHSAKKKSKTSDAAAHDRVKAREMRLRGWRRGFGIPGIAMCATMIGFGLFARDAGFEIYQIYTVTLLLWSMPAMVVFVALFTNGSAFILFSAIAIANVRNLLLVISCLSKMDLRINKIGFMRRMVLAHFVSPTAWTELNLIESSISKTELLHYYVGLCLTLFLTVQLGLIIGFIAHPFLPPSLAVIPIFIMPLYLTSLVMTARQGCYFFAALTGGIVCPLSYTTFGDWSLLVAGLAGSLVTALTAPKKETAT